MEDKFEGGWVIPESGDTQNEFVSEMRMSREEIDRLLLDVDMGVLSLDKQGDVYSFPMSYGYNPDNNFICLMIGYAPRSKKREWIESGGRATFVVHQMGEDGEARSVVIEGELTQIRKEVQGEAYEALKEASFTVLHETGAAIEDSDYSVFRFEVENIEGRKFEHDTAEEVRG